MSGFGWYKLENCLTTDWVRFVREPGGGPRVFLGGTQVARVEPSTLAAGEVRLDQGYVAQVFTSATNRMCLVDLPDEEPGKLYLVSREVHLAAVAQGRKDTVMPGRLTLDSGGRIAHLGVEVVGRPVDVSTRLEWLKVRK